MYVCICIYYHLLISSRICAIQLVFGVRGTIEPLEGWSKLPRMFEPLECWSKLPITFDPLLDFVLPKSSSIC